MWNAAPDDEPTRAAASPSSDPSAGGVQAGQDRHDAARAEQRRERRAAHKAREKAAQERAEAAARRKAKAQARAEAQRKAEAAALAKELHDNPPVQAPFVLGTFNALGASHTDGKRPQRKGWADSTTRTRWTVDLIRSRGLDVVALQEFQAGQHATFTRLAGDAFGSYFPDKGGHNGVVWRKDTFEFVSASVVDIPYFGGRPAPQAAVRLRARATGQEMVFLSVHNPADAHGDAQRWRNESVQREVEFVQSIRASHTPVPVFVLGDMNDREEAFCGLTTGGHLTFPGGGSGAVSGSRCLPPSYDGIDWIFGTPGVTYSEFGADWSTKHGDRKISDHPLVSVRIGD